MLRCELCSMEATEFYVDLCGVAVWQLCETCRGRLSWYGEYREVPQEEYELILLKEAL